MSEETHIFCGGLKPPRSVAALSLNLWGGNDENIQLRIEDFHQDLYKEIPSQFFDLVEIAAYVYCADQAIMRIGQDTDSFGEKWRRKFHFHIPVRNIELWAQAEVKASLTSLLEFLSDDFFHFEFEKAKGPPEFQQYLRLSQEVTAGRPYEKVMMFSGGLDSLAGALEEILVHKSRVVLVTHESTPKNIGLLRDLRAAIAVKADKFGLAKPLHLRVRANKKKALGKDYTQRTRSFLFASFGITVAKMLGIRNLNFFENGIVSLNLPVSAQVVGSRATRTTHPRVLRDFQNLFTLLSGDKISVDNPFLLSTKADVIRKIVAANCGEMIRLSTSCAHTWERTREFTHCGVCSQCIDRRLAIEAAQATQLDPEDHYRTDLFLEPRPADEDKMMLAAYLDRATVIDKLANTSEFISTFPQVVDALQCAPGGGGKSRGSVL